MPLSYILKVIQVANFIYFTFLKTNNIARSTELYTLYVNFISIQLFLKKTTQGSVLHGDQPMSSCGSVNS